MQNVMVQTISTATYIQLASSFCVFIGVCFIYVLHEPLLLPFGWIARENFNERY